MVTRDILPQTQARWKNGDLLLSVIETLIRGLMPCNYRSIWSTWRRCMIGAARLPAERIVGTLVEGRCQRAGTQERAGYEWWHRRWRKRLVRKTNRGQRSQVTRNWGSDSMNRLTISINRYTNSNLTEEIPLLPRCCHKVMILSYYYK